MHPTDDSSDIHNNMEAVLQNIGLGTMYLDEDKDFLDTSKQETDTSSLNIYSIYEEIMSLYNMPISHIYIDLDTRCIIVSSPNFISEEKTYLITHQNKFVVCHRPYNDDFNLHNDSDLYMSPVSRLTSTLEIDKNGTYIMDRNGFNYKYSVNELIDLMNIKKNNGGY